MINVPAQKAVSHSGRQAGAPGHATYHVSSEGSLISKMGSTHPTLICIIGYLVSIKIHIWFLLMKVNLTNRQTLKIQYSRLPAKVIFFISFWVIQWKDSVFYVCFYFIQCSNKISLSVLSHKYALQLTKNTLCKYFSSPWIFKLII